MRIFGRIVYLVGAHDESAVRRIQGATLAIAYVDEATCVPEPFWRMLLSRLSIDGSKLLATCNPEGPTHWLKRDFIDKRETLDLKTWIFTLDDNPILSTTFKENLKKEYTGMWYKRYILGEWAVAQGLVHDGFDETNIYDKEIDNPLYYIAGIDYGTTNPTACLIAAINPTKWPQILIQDEYYYDSSKSGRAKTDAELADDIYNFLKPQCRILRAVYVDPSAASLKLELQRRNLPVLDANNDVVPGVRTVSKYISGKNLLIHRSCRNTLDEIQSYQWDSKAADRGEDKPVKQNDHTQDALRYLCYTHFPTGDFGHPDENLSYDEYRRKIYGESNMGLFGDYGGGYI